MEPIPVNTPDLTIVDAQSVADALDHGWISSEGPQVTRFEELFASTFARRHGIAVSSGTAGLIVAVRALGLAAGDEVLVPSLTIISCALAIVESGAKPVPVDCDPGDWNAHLHNFQDRLTPRTKAIMLVHLYGLCADLDPILEWAREHRLLVIEDASQAHGLTYKGRPCGSFGDISVFSLYANKLITTGEGGMVLCDSDLYEGRCRSLRNLGFSTERRFWHEELGWNYRLTAMQAALGIPQLQRLPELVRRKQAIGRRYHEVFAGGTVFDVAPVARPHAENVYWAFAMTVKDGAGLRRDELTAALASHGIGTRTFFCGLHQQPALLKQGLIEAVSLPTTERVSERGFYLPSGLGLREHEQQRVIEAVHAILKERSLSGVAPPASSIL